MIFFFSPPLGRQDRAKFISLPCFVASPPPSPLPLCRPLPPRAANNVRSSRDLLSFFAPWTAKTVRRCDFFLFALPWAASRHPPPCHGPPKLWEAHVTISLLRPWGRQNLANFLLFFIFIRPPSPPPRGLPEPCEVQATFLVALDGPNRAKFM